MRACVTRDHTHITRIKLIVPDYCTCSVTTNVKNDKIGYRNGSTLRALTSRLVYSATYQFDRLTKAERETQVGAAKTDPFKDSLKCRYFPWCNDGEIYSFLKDKKRLI